jgi:hypothetical protein
MDSTIQEVDELVDGFDYCIPVSLAAQFVAQVILNRPCSCMSGEERYGQR